MFGKKKAKKESPGGFDPPPPPPPPPPVVNDYQTVDGDLSNVDAVTPVPPKQEPIVIINASDDFKMDSLRKKSPDLLALSGSTQMSNYNEEIPEPLPDYPTTPDPLDGGALILPAGVVTSQPDKYMVPGVARDSANRNSYGSETDAENDTDNKYGNGRKQNKHKKGTKASAGHDNPVFQAEGGPVPQSREAVVLALKSNQRHFPVGSLKKVSWNETVVYTSDNKTDIVIAGLHEEESDTDEPGSLSSGSPRTGYLDTIPEDGSLSSHRGRHRRVTNSVKNSTTRDYKCSVCSAVVLISLAAVGIVVLGTMYGVRYANEESASDKLSKIKETFSLLPSGARSVFMFTLYRPPSDQSQDGATYLLLERDSIMPWQSPDDTATLVWLKGEPVKVHVIDRRGQLIVRILGDPVIVPGAQFTVFMTNTDWYAAKLQDPDKYALIALNQRSVSRTWINANVTDLVNRIAPKLSNIITSFKRPTM